MPCILSSMSCTVPLRSPMRLIICPMLSIMVCIWSAMPSMSFMLGMADQMQTMIDGMGQMISLMGDLSGTVHDMVDRMHGMVVDVGEMRDHIADFDDFFRPLRNYFYWEPHCFDIPICWAIRSVFDTLDGIAAMSTH